MSALGAVNIDWCWGVTQSRPFPKSFTPKKSHLCKNCTAGAPSTLGDFVPLEFDQWVAVCSPYSLASKCFSHQRYSELPAQEEFDCNPTGGRINKCAALLLRDVENEIRIGGDG